MEYNKQTCGRLAYLLNRKVGETAGVLPFNFSLSTYPFIIHYAKHITTFSIMPVSRNRPRYPSKNKHLIKLISSDTTYLNGVINQTQCIHVSKIKWFVRYCRNQTTHSPTKCTLRTVISVSRQPQKIFLILVTLWFRWVLGVAFGVELMWI